MSSQSAVFLLNSRLGLFAAARGGPVTLAPRASLLPRLRDDFAEFLNVVSLAHLGLLDPSTCVGLRYGPARSGAAGGFSRPPRNALRRASRRGSTLPYPLFQQGEAPRGRVSAATPAPGAGMFACLPSATPFGLALGPG